MKTMIIYPHGLGDCILATPAIREYKKQTGNFIGFAMLERFKTSQLFAANPYVDELIYIPDVWNDFGSVNEGIKHIKSLCTSIAKDRGYDQIFFVWHSPDGSKILDCAKVLSVELKDVHTEIYIRDEDIEAAKNIIDLESDYGFIHADTGVPQKNLPDHYGQNWLDKNYSIKNFIEVGVEYDHLSVPINVGFVLMQHATRVCLADSVFYHACCALDKKVDLVYFQRGERCYHRVRPLHDVNENVVYYPLPAL